jgi:hypothetical protein
VLHQGAKDWGLILKFAKENPSAATAIKD